VKEREALDVCDRNDYIESQLKEHVMSTQISIRTSEELILKFNELAKETERSRAFLINQAMKEYIAREAWQVAEIRKALQEADSGDFATDEELTVLDAKWSYSEG
jgi:RHH-type transcriptional regulator, rel operon repressor / antitoxin RelB